MTRRIAASHIVALILLVGAITAVPDHVDAKQSSKSCSNPAGWNPRDRRAKDGLSELKHIVARNTGWSFKTVDLALPAHDEYLERVPPTYQYWRREAQHQPKQANLCNANLSRANLSGANLNYANLSGANLTSANLSGAHTDLGDADLTSANLSGANLSGAYLRDAHLSDADTDHTDLTRANLSRANLFAAKLIGADLTEANLSGARLNKADLTEAHLSGEDPISAMQAMLSGEDETSAMRYANLSDANLDHANLTSAILSGEDLRRADLTSAILSGADLRDANLRGAHLSDANLTSAKLSGTHTDLSGADLSGAHLNDANLSDANLSGAHLNDANLSDANLSGANLSGANLFAAKLIAAKLIAAKLIAADLSGADLSGVDLTAADVTDAKLAYTNLTNATYAPHSEPPYLYVAEIRGLATVHLPSARDEVGLVQLRKRLQEAGLRDEERQATYAIEHARASERLSNAWESLAGWIHPKTAPAVGDRGSSPVAAIGEGLAGVASTILFDWTTRYGMEPLRALGSIVVFGALATLIYIRPILHPTEESGVVKIFPADRLDGTKGDPATERERRKDVVRARNWREAFRYAAYFSLLSAVNIGFEKFTPGDWIRRVQRRDHTLEAVGWVRIVSGAQALLSVALFALWLVTQFERPFE